MTSPFKGKALKMVKDTQTIRRQWPTNCLSVSDHFERLALEGLKKIPYLKIMDLVASYGVIVCVVFHVKLVWCE